MDEKFGDGAQAVSALAKHFQLVDGLGGELVGNLMGSFKAENRGVGRFLLGKVFSCGLAESHRRFFHVENVVGYLKGPADGFAKRRRRATSSAEAPEQSAPEVMEARIKAAVFER